MAVPLISNDTPLVTSTEVSSSHTPVGDAVALVSAVSETGSTVRSIPCTRKARDGHKAGENGGRGGEGSDQRRNNQSHGTKIQT